MEELIIIILQGLLEFLFDVLINLAIDLPTYKRKTSEPKIIFPTCFILFCAGCAVAGITLIFFRHTLITTGTLRIVNLALSPITAAFISHTIARRAARTNRNIKPRNHFWKAFWFTLAFVCVRFAYVVRT